MLNGMGEVIKTIGKFFMDLVEVIVISMSIFIVVYMFLAQPHQVKGQSMYPTFDNGEYVMTDKLTYKRRAPKRGEVVVFKAPIAESFDFIKRVIGEPGDRVKVENGVVYVNGQLLDESYLPPEYTTRPGSYMKEGQEIVVPANAFIVMGDNRGHSSDSREWGPVPMENFVGKALFRYWPFNKAMMIRNPLADTKLTETISSLRLNLAVYLAAR